MNEKKPLYSSEKPFAEACERNSQPILRVIQSKLTEASSLIEIGSGTGQHAVYFSEALPHLNWQTSDCEVNHPGIERWISDSKLENVYLPLALDVLQDSWPETKYDAAFSANTAHIMPWEAVVATFEGLSQILTSQARYFLYGPFNYEGKYTSESNANFDIWLKSQAPHQAIRDFEKMLTLAERTGFRLEEDVEMPANNRILIWRKM